MLVQKRSSLFSNFYLYAIIGKWVRFHPTIGSLMIKLHNHPEEMLSLYKTRAKVFIGILGLLFYVGLAYPSFSQHLEIDNPKTRLFNSTDQSSPDAIHLKWHPLAFSQFTEKIKSYYLFFDGCRYDDYSTELPIYFKKIGLSSNTAGFAAELINPVYQSLSSAELANLKDLNKLHTEIKIKSIINYHKKKPYGMVSFIPIRKNTNTGIYEKLTSFELKISYEDGSTNKTKAKKSQQYVTNSVLATGDWHKISLSQNGIYKITYAMMKDMGIAIDAINPQNIRIFGNGGGMLPKLNSVIRPDDLLENAIHVVGETDGSFDPNDYILFYGESPHHWTYNSSEERYHHQVHDYSDANYYFLTTTGGTGSPKRISSQASLLTENTIVSSFDDYAFHEEHLYNLIISGREWFGEHFDNNALSYSFPFSFPNITDSVYLKVSVAGRVLSPNNCSFTLKANNNTLTGLNLNASNVGNGNYLSPKAKLVTDAVTFNSVSSTININIAFNNTESSSEGWLNYLELNTRRILNMSGNQMLFRDARSVGSGNLSKFFLNNVNSSATIWEVTDPSNIVSQQYNLAGTTLDFILQTDSLREFLVFNGNSFLTPINEGVIANQNIHGTIGQPDFVIVTHPNFINEANSLASFHENTDSLDAEVVKTTQVYNEFSSGAQDVTAIKSLMRMLYERAADSTELPRYLLLFGDGSYDNKNQINNNTNYVVTYQSVNSLNPTGSYVSDDYFGLLDENEGESTSNDLDIGIGRIPVKSVSEAQDVLNKILHYEEASTMNPWRNELCFIADDQDLNIHINDADDIATMMDTTYADYDIDKIYLDAYNQESTSAGQRYPEVTDAINRKMERGALILSYTGHGGELGWAHERVLENQDINSWSNYDNMPLFLTATCEFSRFDDPDRTSAGEFVFLNPAGGAIAMLTTVRLVTSGQNKTLSTNFYKTAFKSLNGEMPRLGDVCMKTKNLSGNGSNSRKFVLIGNPAQRLAYPKHIAVTDSINHMAISGSSDTIKALSKVTISGHIERMGGGKFSSFNGTIYPTVYDKASSVTTLQNDPSSKIKTFFLQKNALFRGKASVENGEFAFSFIVPKDIAYQPGFGRISYYAENGETDANGSYEDFVIGGTSSNIEPDNTGPEVRLFLNDTNFVDGGLTDENPMLLAFIADEHGINTTGNGIGHDIVAILDEESDNPIVLNEEYEADRDSYKSGSLQYPFSDLSEGAHKLSLKVWDVYNNSSQVFTDFIVAKSANLALSHVLNYPNPFTTYTEFWFEHNRPGEYLDVQIQVFTISGRLIKTINTNIVTQGFRPNPNQWPSLQWDGKDDFGDKIGRGVYVYHLKVRTPEGEMANKFEKLVILN